jgi:cbb3-type cytochrome oxidase subunit 3
MDYETIISFSKQFTTLLFASFFTGVFIWAYWKGNKEELEGIKLSIFDEDELRRMQ